MYSETSSTRRRICVQNSGQNYPFKDKGGSWELESLSQETGFCPLVTARPDT